MMFWSAVLIVVVAAMPPQQQAAPEPPGPDLYDVTDLIRKIRGKAITPEAQEASRDPRRPAYAIAPVIGYKPASGALFGIGGNVAVLRGDPATTHMSSTVVSATFSTRKQKSIAARFNIFGDFNKTIRCQTRDRALNGN